MLTGQCLCKSISYQITGELLFLYHCHCVECRAYSGASCATNATIMRQDFTLNDPDQQLQRFSTSGEGARCFCKQCGSPLFSYPNENDDYYALHVGSLNDYPEKTLDANLHVAEKCRWTVIDEGLMNFQHQLE